MSPLSFIVHEFLLSLQIIAEQSSFEYALHGFANLARQGSCAADHSTCTLSSVIQAAARLSPSCLQLTSFWAPKYPCNFFFVLSREISLEVLGLFWAATPGPFVQAFSGHGVETCSWLGDVKLIYTSLVHCAGLVCGWHGLLERALREHSGEECMSLIAVKEQIENSIALFCNTRLPNFQNSLFLPACIYTNACFLIHLLMLLSNIALVHSVAQCHDRMCWILIAHHQWSYDACDLFKL